LLTNPTIETADQYWSSFLGCDREVLYKKQTLVIPHADLTDYDSLFLFVRDELFLVSVPPNLLDIFRTQAAAWSRADALEESRLRSLIRVPIELVAGPAFVGYTDDRAFRPATDEDSRFLAPQDITALADLKEACGALEWEHGGSQLGEQPVVGAFDRQCLVAAAGYKVWGSVIAHISVITHPQYRGQGYGKAVVSRLTAEALNRGLAPQYQTLEANIPSMAIGQALGFERYATTVAVRLKSTSI
jgi:GNAT superfamily N-acetyltransferase